MNRRQKKKAAKKARKARMEILARVFFERFGRNSGHAPIIVKLDPIEPVTTIITGRAPDNFEFGNCRGNTIFGTLGKDGK